MFRTILLAGTMMAAAPALAQVTPQAGAPAPATQAPLPGTAQQQLPPATDPGDTAPAPADTAPVPPATDTATAAPDAQRTPAPVATPAPDTAAAAAPSHAQVAQVVDQQFGTYDRNGDGTLDKAEFAAWMDALKTQAKAQSGSPAEQTAWNNAAFRQADGDKSAGVTKTELTGFLVKGASGQS